MINDNENETGNEKQIIGLGLDTGTNILKYKMCLTLMMVMCIKQHLSNI